MTEPTVTLTPEQIDSFHIDGFLAIGSITTPEEVDRIRTIYDGLFADRAGREQGDQFDLAGTDEDDKEAALPQILNPSKYSPELVDTLFRTNAEAIANQLLGSEINLMVEHAILKPAFHGAPTPWHQDEAYFDGSLEYNVVSIWMPLQEATVDNGCLQFIPGSHRQEVLPHHPIGNDPRIHGLEVDEVDESKAVACPIPSGGATFHKSKMLHYAGGNNTDEPRRAYMCVYCTPPTRRSDPRDFYWYSDTSSQADRKRAKKWAEPQESEG